MKKIGLPPLFWFVSFLAIPLLLVFVVSLLTRGTYGEIVWNFSLGSYLRVFQLRYLEIFFQSLKLSTVTAFLCLILAYPMAWAISTASLKYKNILLVLVAIPFFINLIIRIFSIRLIFNYEVNQGLVLYGMVTTYLPFMIFPLYAALEKFDFNLVEACQDLGGNQWTVFKDILWPNTKPAVASGLLLVFVPALGEFVIPDLLGGAKNMLAGNLITEQFLKARDWPFGAALSCVLMLILSVLSFLIYKWGQSGKVKT